MTIMKTLKRRAAKKLRARELEGLRRLLVEERSRLLRLQRHDFAAATALRQEGGEDDEELAAIEADRDLLFSMSEAERERLREIDSALERMKEGTYGICMHSGEPIPLDRLRQVPWAKYRADVQELIEEGLLRAFA